MVVGHLAVVGARALDFELEAVDRGGRRGSGFTG